MTRPTRAELAAECDELRTALQDVREVLDEVLGDDEADETRDDDEDEVAA